MRLRELLDYKNIVIQCHDNPDADAIASGFGIYLYLKENLPLLKQKFSEQGLDYDELNQRERRNPDRDQNKKKGRENE